ncbi:MAG: hypothetical protein KDE20_07115 [Caldilineaceae bacterium]|nr:hypothetical protein [Caldilineaceae bacterium]
MTETMIYLEKLVKETNKSEADVMAEAMRTGLRQMWQNWILGRYLRDEITREEAVDVVGIDLVELAERQRAAMLEDVAWGQQA